MGCALDGAFLAALRFMKIFRVVAVGLLALMGLWPVTATFARGQRADLGQVAPGPGGCPFCPHFPGGTPPGVPSCIGASRFAALTGSDEVPPVATSGTGRATVVIDCTHTQIVYSVSTAGLADIAATHIHVGATGENGPIIFTLKAGATPATFTGSLSASDFTPAPDQGINSFADAVNAVLSDRTYFNVHTNANPGGAVRGQTRANGTRMAPSEST